jgi:hypothetical protein
MAQVVEHLPSKLKALSSNFSPAKKKKKVKTGLGMVEQVYNPRYVGDEGGRLHKNKTLSENKLWYKDWGHGSSGEVIA